MKKTAAIILIVGVFFTSLIAPITINAQQVFCVPGTGGAGQPVCQPCNPGPYNICVPETGIIETISEDLNSVQFVLVFGVLISVGYILILNGKKLKNVTKYS